MIPRLNLAAATTTSAAVTLVLLLACGLHTVRGHGRLVEPPSRSSMWRYGFRTERNYNDNELFCGGYSVQWQRNGGKCGVCGDPWHEPEPRKNEAGGKYGKGIIVRRYKRGQVIKATVQLTANHRGFFEFRLCPVNDPKVRATDECMAQYPLRLAEGGSGPDGTRYMVPGGRSRDFSVRLQLPDHLTCTQCVFQWTYTAGNNWGRCENGSSGVGCGPQETFRGCADITIEDGSRNPNDIDDGPNPPSPTRKPPTRRPQPYTRPPTRRAFPSTTTRRPWWKPTTPASRRPQYPTRVYTRSTTTTTRRPFHEVEENFGDDYDVYNTVVPRRPQHEVEGLPDFYPAGYTQGDADVPAVQPQPTDESVPDVRPHEVEGDRNPGFHPIRPVGPGFTANTPEDHTYVPTMVNRRYTPWTVNYDTAASTLPTSKVFYTDRMPQTTSRHTERPKRRFSPAEVTTVESRRRYYPEELTTEAPESRSGNSCSGVGIWKALPGIDQWCDDNCAWGYCPASHCAC